MQIKPGCEPIRNILRVGTALEDFQQVTKGYPYRQTKIGSGIAIKFDSIVVFPLCQRQIRNEQIVVISCQLEAVRIGVANSEQKIHFYPFAVNACNIYTFYSNFGFCDQQ
jgi:hypothetical protein